MRRIDEVGLMVVVIEASQCRLPKKARVCRMRKMKNVNLPQRMKMNPRMKRMRRMRRRMKRRMRNFFKKQLITS